MIWKNFLNSFRKRTLSEGEIQLYCDNPQCGEVIQKGPVAYDRDMREIYHNGHCAVLANAHKVFASGNISV
jgi:hypothetical protein